MEWPGGIEFQVLLNKFAEELDNYFAALNEKKIAPRSKVALNEPELYLVYKQCKSMGIPLVHGGLVDQPYEWLKIYALIERLIERWRALGAPI